MVEASAAAVRLSVADKVMDEDARLAPEHTCWLGATQPWQGSSRTIEAVVGSVGGTLMCKLWLDAAPTGGEHQVALCCPDPKQWATERKRAWLRLVTRRALQPSTLLVGAVVGIALAAYTGQALSGGEALVVIVALYAWWQADYEWRHLDLPYQRRVAWLSGQRLLSEGVKSSQRWIGNTYFVFGALFVLSSARGVASFVLQAEVSAAYVFTFGFLLGIGAIGVLLLRSGSRRRRPSLSLPYDHSHYSDSPQTRREIAEAEERAVQSKVDALPPIGGVHLRPGARGRSLHFDSDVGYDTFVHLLTVLRQVGIEFEVYDALYPQVSDPGAYLSYRPIDGVWHMTLGNHGWSGGIYQIETAVVCQQLYNLHTQRVLEDVSVEKVAFFAHYALESPEKNQRMNQQLGEIHGAPTVAP